MLDGQGHLQLVEIRAQRRRSLRRPGSWLTTVLALVFLRGQSLHLVLLLIPIRRPPASNWPGAIEPCIVEGLGCGAACTSLSPLGVTCLGSLTPWRSVVPLTGVLPLSDQPPPRLARSALRCGGSPWWILGLPGPSPAPRRTTTATGLGSGEASLVARRPL
eukprot:Rmarinus@m.17148